jgi:hypothetical protein
MELCQNLGILTLMHSTVSSNSASSGGGIFNSVIGIIALTRTILAGNSAFESTPSADCDNQALLISQGHNLIGVGTGCPSDGPGDLTVDPDDVFTTVPGSL